MGVSTRLSSVPDKCVFGLCLSTKNKYPRDICPGIVLMENCDVDCAVECKGEDDPPGCTGECNDLGFGEDPICFYTYQALVCTGDISGVSKFLASNDKTTWILGEGKAGASCTLKCPDANLDVTTECSKKGGKMEWSVPADITTKCG